jgi:predicted xylose isomerase-like sugar epimerase
MDETQEVIGQALAQIAQALIAVPLNDRYALFADALSSWDHETLVKALYGAALVEASRLVI